MTLTATLAFIARRWAGCCIKAVSDKSLMHTLLARLLRLGPGDPPARRARAAAANSAALRQHFSELTGTFLTPFAAFWLRASASSGCPAPAALQPHRLPGGVGSVQLPFCPLRALWEPGKLPEGHRHSADDEMSLHQPLILCEDLAGVPSRSSAMSIDAVMSKGA